MEDSRADRWAECLMRWAGLFALAVILGVLLGVVRVSTQLGTVTTQQRSTTR
jgi:hypothetical protein